MGVSCEDHWQDCLGSSPLRGGKSNVTEGSELVLMAEDEEEDAEKAAEAERQRIQKQIDDLAQQYRDRGML